MKDIIPIEQRNRIYKDALKRYKERGRHVSGLCYEIAQSAPQGKQYSPYINMENYPEILKHKPDQMVNTFYWWYPNESEIRIKVLEQAILETE